MIPAAEVALQTAVSMPLRVTRRIVSFSWSSESPADPLPPGQGIRTATIDSWTDFAGGWAALLCGLRVTSAA
jgi:hypothetical protein